MVMSVITGGETPHRATVSEFLALSRVIIAADSGFDLLADLNITPHWIVGDMDSLTKLNQLLAFPPEKIHLHPRKKDFTDTELAIELALLQGATDIHLLGGAGGRMDHYLANHSLVSRTPQIKTWITSSEICSVVDDRWKGLGHIGDRISIFPLGRGPWEIQSEGLEWSLNAVNFEWNFSLSNVLSNNEFNLKVLKGRFLVIRPIEGCNG